MTEGYCIYIYGKDAWEKFAVYRRVYCFLRDPWSRSHMLSGMARNLIEHDRSERAQEAT